MYNLDKLKEYAENLGGRAERFYEFQLEIERTKSAYQGTYLTKIAVEKNPQNEKKSQYKGD